MDRHTATATIYEWCPHLNPANRVARVCRPAACLKGAPLKDRLPAPAQASPDEGECDCQQQWGHSEVGA